MGVKVRGYKREVTQDKVRDYRLFAIACEGTVTEPLKTKVYLLAQALYDRIGKRSFDAFVARLPQLEKKLLAKKNK